MGKLGDLWQQIRDMNWDDPRRNDVQKEINSIEEWMITKGIKKDGITQWGEMSGGNSIIYPHHTGYVRFEDISMVGELNGKGLHYNSDGSVHICPICSDI